MRLSCTDADVSVVARGAHGRAIQQAGLTLVAGHERRTVQLECVETPAALPRQDIVIVAVKGLQLAAIAEPLTSLLRPDTRVVFAMNGIPWCSYSSTSDMSCPIWRKAAPHAAQLHPAAGLWITVSRGKCSGNSHNPGRFCLALRFLRASSMLVTLQFTGSLAPGSGARRELMSSIWVSWSSFSLERP